MKRVFAIILAIVLLMLSACTGTPPPKRTPEPPVSNWSALRPFSTDLDPDRARECNDIVSGWLDENLPEIHMYNVLFEDSYIAVADDYEQADRYEYIRYLEAKVEISRADNSITIEILSDRVTKTAQIETDLGGVPMYEKIGETEVLYEQIGTGLVSRIYINGKKTRIERPSGGGRYTKQKYEDPEIAESLRSFMMPVDSGILAGDTVKVHNGNNEFVLYNLISATGIYNAFLLMNGDNVYEAVEVAARIFCKENKKEVYRVVIHTKLSLLEIAYPAVSGKKNPFVFDGASLQYSLIIFGDSTN